MPESLEFLPAELNLTFYRGDTWEWEFSISDEAGTVVPFTIAKMQVRTPCDDGTGTTLLEFSTSNGRITVNLTTFVATLSVPAVQTETITWSRGEYDLQITYPSGKPQTELRGTFHVEGDITRA